jgi:predicted ATPase
MIDTNWHVITGGPSSGKTKIIERLAFLGYLTVPEAARILIDNERSKGRTTEEIRADEAEFQRIVLQMKIDVENRMPPNQIIFFERGIPDSIAYYKVCGVNTESAIRASQKRRYKMIFLLEQLPFEKDYARVEDEKLANELSQLIHDSYSELGYNVIRVPLIKPIDRRVEFILSKIQKS